MSVENVEVAIREVHQTMNEAAHLVDRKVMSVRYSYIDPVLLALGWSIALPWECEPNFGLTNRGVVDYALFDRDGCPAVLIVVGTERARRPQDRVRLWQRVRGMTQGVAVLTSGWDWEIYDLSVRARGFDRKRVQQLVLDLRSDDSPPAVAAGLHRWMSRDRWW